MKEELPQSLVAFEAQLEDAVRRELDSDPARPAPAGRSVRRAGRLGRARRRVVAATGAAGLSLAGAATAVVLLLGTGATAPAYAVTQNTNGTITVRFLRVSGIDRTSIHSLNAQLAGMGVKAEVVPGTAHVVSAWVNGRAVTCAALQAVTLSPSEINHVTRLAVDDSGRISVPTPQRQAVGGGTHTVGVQVSRSSGPSTNGPSTISFAGSGNTGSGNTGNSGSGNTGNSGSGNSGNSGSPQVQTVPRWTQAVPTASLPPGAIAHARAFAVRCGGLSQGGNSGNSGNSGSGTGNSGNSG
jgi:hypothetical protein